ncbi:MAG: 2-isopropylmalate synthase [Clostridia bacterium]|nr:2-isopropylmalate synthase [Clostridia bacterium]
MRQIKIFDTTLRDGEQSPHCSMNLAEKLTLAKQLEMLGVDVIEAGFAIASPDDFKSVEAIAQAMEKSVVASLARCTKGDIDTAWAAVKSAKHPRIHIFLATSDIHMQYKLKISREQALAKIAAMVAHAKSLCPDVEFSAEDASRSDRDFLVACLGTAIKAGATVINIPDTVGYAAPDEMYALVSYVKEHTPGIESVDISVHCHNDLGMAVANSLAAIRAGATQVECTVNGIGERAGNAALEEIVMALATRGEHYGATTGIQAKQIYRTSKMLANIIGIPIPHNKPIVGANAFAHESGIHQHGVLANPLTYEIMVPTDIGIPVNNMVLGKHSGKHALREILEAMGYEICDHGMDEIFDHFKQLADKKKEITNQDLEALMLSRHHRVAEQKYELIGHIVSAGNDMTNTACIKIRDGEIMHEEVAMGDGPIDAAFKAINRIVDLPVRLESFSLNAVTNGEDAMGEAVVQVSANNRRYIGTGMSTDIIEASLKAYLNGINKLIAE